MLKPGLQIVSESWHLYKQNWRQYMPYLIVTFIPTFILSVVGTIATYLATFFPASSIISSIIILLLYPAGIVLGIWAGIALVKAITASITGQTTAWKDNFSTSNHLIWPTIYISILTGLIIFLGLILLIIPGIIFAVWYGFGYYAVILDNSRGLDPLRTSKAIVKGQWWSILWRWLVIGAIFILVSLAAIILVISLVSLLPMAEFLQATLASLITSLVSAAFTQISVAASIILYLNAKQNPASTTPTTTPPQV